jgi:hypothetical protein
MIHSILTSIRNTFAGFSWIKVALIAGAMMVALGIIHFWGGEIHWGLALVIFLIAIFFLLFSYLLLLKTMLENIKEKKINDATFLTIPWKEPVSIQWMDLNNFIERSLLIAGTLIAALSLIGMRLSKNPLTLNFLIFGAIVLLILSWKIQQKKLDHWILDFTDVFFVILFPALFVLLNHEFHKESAYFAGFFIPEFLFYLAFRFVGQMAAVDKMIQPDVGSFPRAIRHSRIIVHHLFLAFGFLAIVVSNLMGVHWRVLSPQLFCIISASIQIIRLEKIMQGSRINWKLDGVLAIGNILLLMYFQAVPLWIAPI